MTIPSGRLLRLSAIWLAWTAFGLLLVGQTEMLMSIRGESRPAWSVLATSFLTAWTWALFTPGIVVVARRLRTLRERDAAPWRGWLLFLAAHLVVATLTVVVDTLIWTAVRPLIDGVVVAVPRAFAGALITGAAAYLAVVTVTEAADFASRWRERERAAASLARDAETLRRQLDEARLTALESQLKPHFLYNTLNLVAELVHAEPDEADAMLTDLGMLLRRSYQEMPHLVPLREELRFVRAYAEILARRYRDRVALVFDVAPALGAQMVPAFLLQPLVENAFRHGVERREGASGVQVTAIVREESLVLRVRDHELAQPWQHDHEPGYADLGDTPDSLRPDGIGLRNTRERLQVLYGAEAGLAFVRSGGAAVASVWLPLDPDVGRGIGESSRGRPIALREA